MQYDTSKLRKLEKGSTPNFSLRSMQSATVLCIRGNGTIEWARTRGDKDKLVQSVNWAEDVLLWPWVGQWHTEIFLVTKEDIEKYYESSTRQKTKD